MTTYTADDFKRAEFAIRDRSYSARHAMRCNVDSPTPWQGQYGAWRDDQMAAAGWVPVSAGSYTRTDEPRPLSSTKEMVDRAHRCAQELLGGGIFYLGSRWAIEKILTAALTEPTRPEGAEEIEAWLDGMPESIRLDGDEHQRLFANHLAHMGFRVPVALAERGVRVVGEEQP